MSFEKNTSFLVRIKIREGEYEPKLIPKYQRDISGIEKKVISLYARGMSTRTQRYLNWDQVLNQRIVLYGDRITQYL